MSTPPAQLSIGVEGITEVACGVWGSVNDGLHYFRRSVLADRVRDDAPSLPINEGDDKDWLFLVPMKVNNSSISRVETLPGTGRASFRVRSCA